MGFVASDCTFLHFFGFTHKKKNIFFFRCSAVEDPKLVKWLRASREKRSNDRYCSTCPNRLAYTVTQTGNTTKQFPHYFYADCPPHTNEGAVSKWLVKKGVGGALLSRRTDGRTRAGLLLKGVATAALLSRWGCPEANVDRVVLQYGSPLATFLLTKLSVLKASPGPCLMKYSAP